MNKYTRDRQTIIDYNYKTTICQNWAKYGECSYKDYCYFAHGNKELMKLGEYIKKKNKEKIKEKEKEKIKEKIKEQESNDELIDEHIYWNYIIARKFELEYRIET